MNKPAAPYLHYDENAVPEKPLVKSLSSHNEAQHKLPYSLYYQSDAVQSAADVYAEILSFALPVAGGNVVAAQYDPSESLYRA